MYLLLLSLIIILPIFNRFPLLLRLKVDMVLKMWGEVLVHVGH